MTVKKVMELFGIDYIDGKALIPSGDFWTEYSGEEVDAYHFGIISHEQARTLKKFTNAYIIHNPFNGHYLWCLEQSNPYIKLYVTIK